MNVVVLSFCSSCNTALMLLNIFPIDEWLLRAGVLPGATEYRASVDLVNGTFHDILMEYKENDGAASIQVGG